MNFINNWSGAVQLAAGVTTLDLDLPDGRYLLTITDSQAEPTRWEIVEAQVQGAAATLVRGREGTLEQDWPAGSLIYLSVTAGWLISVEQRLAAQAMDIEELRARVVALERGDQAGALTNSAGDPLVNATGQILTTGAAT